MPRTPRLLISDRWLDGYVARCTPDVQSLKATSPLFPIDDPRLDPAGGDVGGAAWCLSLMRADKHDNIPSNELKPLIRTLQKHRAVRQEIARTTGTRHPGNLNGAIAILSISSSKLGLQDIGDQLGPLHRSMPADIVNQYASQKKKGNVPVIDLNIADQELETTAESTEVSPITLPQRHSLIACSGAGKTLLFRVNEHVLAQDDLGPGFFIEDAKKSSSIIATALQFQNSVPGPQEGSMQNPFQTTSSGDRNRDDKLQILGVMVYSADIRIILLRVLAQYPSLSRATLEEAYKHLVRPTTILAFTQRMGCVVQGVRAVLVGLGSFLLQSPTNQTRFLSTLGPLVLATLNLILPLASGQSFTLVPSSFPHICDPSNRMPTRLFTITDIKHTFAHCFLDVNRLWFAEPTQKHSAAPSSSRLLDTAPSSYPKVAESGIDGCHDSQGDAIDPVSRENLLDLCHEGAVLLGLSTYDLVHGVCELCHPEAAVSATSDGSGDGEEGEHLRQPVSSLDNLARVVHLGNDTQTRRAMKSPRRFSKPADSTSHNPILQTTSNSRASSIAPHSLTVPEASGSGGTNVVVPSIDEDVSGDETLSDIASVTPRRDIDPEVRDGMSIHRKLRASPSTNPSTSLLPNTTPLADSTSMPTHPSRPDAERTSSKDIVSSETPLHSSLRHDGMVDAFSGPPRDLGMEARSGRRSDSDLNTPAPTGASGHPGSDTVKQVVAASSEKNAASEVSFGGEDVEGGQGPVPEMKKTKPSGAVVHDDLDLNSPLTSSPSLESIPLMSRDTHGSQRPAKDSDAPVFAPRPDKTASRRDNSDIESPGALDVSTPAHSHDRPIHDEQAHETPQAGPSYTTRQVSGRTGLSSHRIIREDSGARSVVVTSGLGGADDDGSSNDKSKEESSTITLATPNSSSTTSDSRKAGENPGAKQENTVDESEDPEAVLAVTLGNEISRGQPDRAAPLSPSKRGRRDLTPSTSDPDLEGTPRKRQRLH